MERHGMSLSRAGGRPSHATERRGEGASGCCLSNIEQQAAACPGMSVMKKNQRMSPGHEKNHGMSL